MPNKTRNRFNLITALFFLLLGVSFFILALIPHELEAEYLEDPEPEIVAPPLPTEPLILVAHSGGAISGNVYSNALEAFEASVAYGITLIEVDFMPTTDGEIVLTHVWQNMSNRIPGAPDHIVSHEEFMAYRLFNRYTTMDLSMLIAFLDEHPEVRIVTDTKDGYDNYTALYAIAERYPEYRDRFIAQAYRFEHVHRLRALGFEDVIVTLYLMPGELFENPAEIKRLAEEYEVYAITIQEYGITPEFAAEMGVWDIRFFAHTVNSDLRARELWEMGFYGIYTNFLIYDETDTLVPARAPEPEPLLTRLEENLVGLEEEKLEMLQRSLLYRLDTPVYFRYGTPLLVSHMGTSVPYPNFARGIASPFAHFDTGVLYFPLGNLLTEAMSYTWDGETSTLTIGILPITEEFLLYRSHIFINEALIGHLFAYHILRVEDYVLVSPVYTEWTEEDLLTLAEIVFAGI